MRPNLAATATIVVALGAGLCLVACGASGGGTSQTQAGSAIAQQTQSSTTQVSLATLRSGPATTAVGMFTLSVPRSSVILAEDVRLAPAFRYDAVGVPVGVTDATLAEPGSVARSAYLYARITLRYVLGTKPLNVRFQLGTGAFGNVAMEPFSQGVPVWGMNGRWLDDNTNGEGVVGMTLAPGFSQTYPVWFVVPNPTSPQFSSDQTETTSFTYTPLLTDFVSEGLVTTVSGPKAADCEGDHELLPFATLPFRFSPAPADGANAQHMKCVAGGGPHR